MKFCINFLFGIMVSILCLCDAMALPGVSCQIGQNCPEEDDPEALLDCPAGCFCINDGKYNSHGDRDFFIKNCDTTKAKSAIDYESFYVCSGSIGRDKNKEATDYYFSDFSELYDGKMGFYGFMNDEFVYGNDCAPDGRGGIGPKYDYIFNCPNNYPHSDKGSKALTNCFKYDENGKKVYYGSEKQNLGKCNMDAFKTKIEELQETLNKANETLTELQKSVNKTIIETQTKNLGDTKAIIDAGMVVNAQENNYLNNSTSKNSKTDISAMKAMISAGITDTKAVSDKRIKKVRK